MSAERFRFAVVILLAVAVAVAIALTIAEFLRYQDFMAWCLDGFADKGRARGECALWWRHGTFK